MIDFQLHTHKQRTLAVKDGRRLVVITSDGLTADFVVTGLTVRLVGIVMVVGIVNMQKRAAGCTENVVVLITVPAEGIDMIAFRLSSPEPVKTAVAECSVLFQTVLTHDSVVKLMCICFTEHSSAEMAYAGVGHRLFLLM
jgi:hypothetical protein